MQSGAAPPLQLMSYLPNEPPLATCTTQDPLLAAPASTRHVMALALMPSAIRRPSCSLAPHAPSLSPRGSSAASDDDTNAVDSTSRLHRTLRTTV